MKIKLALLEKDRNYLNRIVSVFNTKYSDKFEIYSFSDLDMALETIENIKIDVFVVDEVFDIDLSKLPKRCGMAYFVDSADIDTFKEKRAICKFQKMQEAFRNLNLKMVIVMLYVFLLHVEGVEIQQWQWQLQYILLHRERKHST